MKEHKFFGKTVMTDQTTRIEVNLKITVDADNGVFGKGDTHKLSIDSGVETLEKIEHALSNIDSTSIVNLEVDGKVIGDVDNL